MRRITRGGPAGVTVSSQELVALRLERKFLKRLIHPADLPALREHFAARESERQSRLAAMTALVVDSSRQPGGGSVAASRR